MRAQNAFQQQVEEYAVNNFRLPGQAHVGFVHLQVSSLKRSLHFYETLLGLKKAIDLGSTVVLSASGKAPYHILLTELPGALPKPPRSSGLYHVAIRFPNRRELAKVFRRLYVRNTEFQGFSDHLVSEAIYLADPDENGIELYVDRPRTEWVMKENQVQMATLPLNLDSLIGELRAEDSDADPVDSNTDIGHVHLHVSNLHKADEFYNGLLGFDVTQRSYPGALFLSAGGYHHHLGVNTWAGQGVPPPPGNAVGLLRFGINLPDRQSMDSTAQHLEEHGAHFEFKQDEILNTEILRVKTPDTLNVDLFIN